MLKLNLEASCCLPHLYKDYQRNFQQRKSLSPWLRFLQTYLILSFSFSTPKISEKQNIPKDWNILKYGFKRMMITMMITIYTYCKCALQCPYKQKNLQLFTQISQYSDLIPKVHINQLRVALMSSRENNDTKRSGQMSDAEHAGEDALAHAILECLGFKPGSTLNFSFCSSSSLGHSRWWPKHLAPCHHHGDTGDTGVGFGLAPAGIWGVTQHTGSYSLPLLTVVLTLCFPPFFCSSKKC